MVELVDAPEGSARRKLVKSVKGEIYILSSPRRTASDERLVGKHHVITPEMASSQQMKQLLSTLLSDVGSALKAPVCRTLTEFNCKSGPMCVLVHLP